MEGSDGRTMFSVSADSAVSSVSVIRRGGERVKGGIVMESAAACGRWDEIRPLKSR
jgi:hypothetical protein